MGKQDSFCVSCKMQVSCTERREESCFQLRLFYIGNESHNGAVVPNLRIMCGLVRTTNLERSTLWRCKAIKGSREMQFSRMPTIMFPFTFPLMENHAWYGIVLDTMFSVALLPQLFLSGEITSS